jgi:hypothetical protein
MLLLYAYCVGVVSSRKIERACYEDLAFRVLTGNQQPDHSRISEFRRRNLDALKGLFIQILRLCQKAGMVSLGHVALDGTKVQANASKHKAMSHERMLRAEKELERIALSVGASPDVMTMDAGYWSEDNAKACADQGIDAYIATGRLPHGQPPPPKRGPLPKDADVKTHMARKLRSKKGSRIYAQRKAIVEPVNGQIKEARSLRRFLLRGLEKVECEWHLIAATHNLLKLFRHRRAQQQAWVAATG